MNKLRILSLFAILLLATLSISTVSAYSHATFPVSDKITYNEDIKGGNRGFSLTRSTDVSRWNGNYYDWSYKPRTTTYPHSDSYRISDRLASQAFRTFQQDSRDQTRLEREDRERHHGYGYSRYSGYRHRPYYRYSYRF